METQVPADRIITENGEYYFDPSACRLSQGRECIVEIDVHPEEGSFGGRTVTVGYEGDSGNFVAFRDGLDNEVATVEAKGFRVPVPRSGRVAVKVAGDGAEPKLMVSAISAP
jgi:hypothetical protein